MAKKTFTLNKFQFFGMITVEYRDQIVPVHARDRDWPKLSFSAGRARSAMPAMTSPHLKEGAQKWMVCRPAGWFHRGRSFDGRFRSISRRTFAPAIVDVDVSVFLISVTICS